ncbi:MAG: hypothetical protein IJB11_00110 [Oscillospiraceae bacterium]|nr:hypothetical protein [Oscillospiraceae bacterium]
MQTNQSCGKMKTNQGWSRGADKRINSSRAGLCCPNCGFLIHKLLPETEARNFVVYCRKCKHESIVNISSVPVP